MVPHKLWQFLFYFCEKCPWDFWRGLLWICTLLQVINILAILILPNHEHGLSFHLFVSFSIAFINVLQFLKHSYFITTFVKFIPISSVIQKESHSSVWCLDFYKCCQETPLHCWIWWPVVLTLGGLKQLSLQGHSKIPEAQSFCEDLLANHHDWSLRSRLLIKHASKCWL